MKHALRTEMKAKLAGMDAGAARAKSRAACEGVLALDEYRAARVVMLYLPIPHEVDTADIALRAWQAGKTVVVPKIDYDKWRISTVVCRSLDENLVTDLYGIPGPADAEYWPAKEIDLVVVPALACDRAGNRLGRGGGLYDRFLAEPDVTAVLCGLAFDEQVVDDLPAEHHDRPVDLLVTDKETLRFNR